MAEVQPNKRVSEETAATTVTGGNLVRIVQGTGTELDPYVSKRTTISAIVALASGGGAGIPPDAVPGSILYVDADGNLAALPPGDDGDILTIGSGMPSYSAPGVSTAFRWFRIYIVNNGGNSYTAFGSLELRATHGGADQTTPSTPAYANSSFSLTPPDKAIDNVTGDTWINNGDGLTTWWACDLATTHTVTEFTMRPQSGNVTRAPTLFALQGSNSTASHPGLVTDWQSIASFSYTGWADGVTSTFSF
jgi:hypothetical protein